MTTNRSDCLPTFVGQYERSKVSPRITRSDQKVASIEEKKLRHFYKCTKFNLTNAKTNCFATKNFNKNFLHHLNTKHKSMKFYCVYCYPKTRINEKELKKDNLI